MSESPQAFDPQWVINIEERRVDGPEPIERVLYLNAESLAVAYLDEPRTEATLAWPVLPNHRLRPVLNHYLGAFLPRCQPRPSENTLEFWMGERYYKNELDYRPTSLSVIEHLQAAREHEQERPGLLQISSQSVVMEVLFDNSTGHPIRLGLLISAVPVRALAKFFSEFHRNQVVRNNLAIAVHAFSPDTRTPRVTESLLHPLPIIPERS